MQLLAHLQGARAGEPEPDLAALVPRLWPFFRHTLVSVRLSTVCCLRALLAGNKTLSGTQTQYPSHQESLAAAPAAGSLPEAAGPERASGVCAGRGADPGGSVAGSGPLAWLAPEVLTPALRLVFQNLVLESDARVLEASQVLPSPEGFAVQGPVCVLLLTGIMSIIHTNARPTLHLCATDTADVKR